jgi:hypothetical protein
MLGGDFDADSMQADWQLVTVHFRKYGMGLSIFGNWFNLFPVAVAREYLTAMNNIVKAIEKVISNRRKKIQSVHLVSLS